ncbi:MAG: multicopper oxidase family protein [Thermomicrobium sp.]|nr:multicopper oxidase family protein [Thermomicrobium sp.]MDW8007124.1 multicopper oxidase family protein [Thermomicrobium sp.]
MLECATQRRCTRRRFLASLLGSTLLATACARQPATPSVLPTAAPRPTFTTTTLTPSSSAAGTVRTYTLEAREAELTLGSFRVRTFTYDGQLPGPELRVREGETLRVTFTNRLPEPTTIHWHGIPVPNAMDGVPDVTQPAIAPGASFTYEFTVPASGTYFYHTHVGLQLDRGLAGALIVEPREESLSYDREVTLVLDDWLDGIDGTPEEALRRLASAGHGAHGSMPMQPGMGTMPGMGMPGMGSMPGMRSGGEPAESEPDLFYPLYLVMGQPPDTPFEFSGKRGEVLRVRLINAASATIFRVVLVGHRLEVVQADGQPVEPLEGDVLRIGMGERYDVLVRLDNPGVWPLVAWVEGTSKAARAILRYEGSTGTPPPTNARPQELDGELLHALRFRTATPGTAAAPDIERTVVLGGGMGQYVWTIDGQAYPRAEPIQIALGRHVRFRLQNMTTMPHPMHLHGHFFRVGDPVHGPLRDTVLVEPMQEVTIDWLADNPGRWAFHCHHLYHQETGMMRIIEIA